jgi:lipopolysaccharide export LptBFGC system permease protein LptF
MPRQKKAAPVEVSHSHSHSHSTPQEQHLLKTHFLFHMITYLALLSAIPLIIVGFVKFDPRYRIAGFAMLGIGLIGFFGVSLWSFIESVS